MKADMTIEEALATLRGVELDDLSHLPPELQERIPQSRVFAEEAAAKAARPRLNDVQKLLAVAVKAPTSGQRVMWLHAASQALADAHGANAACRKGCSHCCHIPVKLTHTEALYIGKKIGRRPNTVEASTPDPIIEGYESPCTFLQKSACSIYEHRPGVCRSHLNMDRDDLLCRLIPGMGVPVPYADTRELMMVTLLIAGRSTQMADIRQWFGPTHGQAALDSPSR